MTRFEAINPLVSIIIPVYNGSNYLREAIESALGQTYKNIELIVVNDGSNDGGATERIALSYGNRLAYYSKPNGGVSTALNYAIERMRGEYFSWLSHDDVYYFDKIERQIAALRDGDNMERVVYGDFDMFDENAKRKYYQRCNELYPDELLSDSVFPVVKHLISGCAMLIHRSHFDRVGLFKTELRYTQDYDMWFRMLRGQKIVYVACPMYTMRIHDGQVTQAASTQMHVDNSKLWFDMARSLSREEAARMFGSLHEFYREMYIKLAVYGAFDAAHDVLRMCEEENAFGGSSEEISRLKNHIFALSGGIANKICIFCAGVYGMTLYYALRTRMIKVDCLADNNPAKQGTILANGISCLSFEDLSAMRENTLVIVANRYPDEIVAQLRRVGFPFVTTNQALDQALAPMRLSPFSFIYK